MAHEINNPLAVIQSRVQLLKRQGPASDPEVFRQQIATIEDSLSRVNSIVNDMRNMLDNADLKAKISTNAQSILDEALRLCQSMLKNKDIQLIIEGDFQVPIFGHPQQLSLILLHLIRNAHDAIQNQELKWIRITSSKKNHLWILKVSDSGAGIEQKNASQIMNPFYTTKQADGNGKGLGLSISQGIAENHSGKLYLDSNFPPTCFVLEIPLLESEKQTLPAKP